MKLEGKRLAQVQRAHSAFRLATMDFDMETYLDTAVELIHEINLDPRITARHVARIEKCLRKLDEAKVKLIKLSCSLGVNDDI